MAPDTNPSNPKDQIVYRYRDLQEYIDWSDRDVAWVQQAGPLVEAGLPGIVDDFYREIERHPEANKVFTGGPAQVARLQASLRRWLDQLFLGEYDHTYVLGRWQVGLRHAEIGLHQVYTNMALSRLRQGIHRLLRAADLPTDQLWAMVEAVNKALDLDLAIIEDSYEYHRLRLEKLAERERSERKFRNLVEAAACLIVILRDDSRIVYFSPYAERLTGYPAEDVQGVPFVERFAHDAEEADSADQANAASRADPSDARGLWQVALSDLPVNDCEMPIRVRDGSFRWLVWNALRLEEFDGEPAILAVGHDVTEKRRSAERLLQAERLAAIGQTITGLAHESRNALQRINSCTEMLEFEVEGNEEAMQLIRRSQKAQDDLTRLFDEVRSFAAPITLERSSCEVDHVWREAWQLVQGDCRGRDAQLEETMLTDFRHANVDRFRLVQVFRNLFENSLAACTDPVRIQVSCRCVPHESDRGAIDRQHVGRLPEPLPGATPVAASDRLEIRVRDNGPGLTPRARREVFEPFFTTKSKGTGLGMAIADRILDAHGGSIAVGDSSTSGAEFVLTLPIESSS
jgi:two-component system, LuxR family, sensor kinase FixL